ncbi:methionine sulfoxide reductase A [Acaromyces ingoldii]|uniref:peptide-methionine (S)-S-oxide reductase n=1 Tax=Acaromyces ingoldii TaxID=215250 RepID=A0A316YX97_9BASI|nr:methionine sulfoxide reductase A [Acaromyces ingoldii]PWN94140.1 methionine sulfoxide reductase A [Acaromyces ingoldii]
MGAATEPTVPSAIAARQALKDGSATANKAAAKATDKATVAGGCFWGVEHMFRKYYGDGRGLIDAKSGFIGGKESSRNPSYEEVCTGKTGHAEATQITFDPTKVTYAELVEFFYRTHDPTQLNAQGHDQGTQYRSAIFPHDEKQRFVALKVTQEVQEKHFAPEGRKIVTQVEQRPAEDFFLAEEYHQRYLERNSLDFHCSTHKLWW